MTFRFVHSSDLHLGKGFGTLPEDLRGRLVEARHEVLARLAQAARDRGAAHVLLAGDTFDTTGPSEQVRRQAASAMTAANDIHWWIIPGNHDSLAGEELWQRFEAEAGPNVHLLREPAPVEIAPGVQLLPSPLPRRFPGHDLTAWMDEAATPESAVRIGLAHGGITDFGKDFDSSARIAPDRAARARLDYLALGDWHGMLAVGDRTRYSGTPERDRFRHDGRGSCLAVTIEGAGAKPSIEEVTVGRFDWSAPVLDLSPDEDVADRLQALLPPDPTERRDVLLRVVARGFLRMAERGALEAAARAAAPDFAFFDLDQSGLRTEYEAGDLDLIAPGGALRRAAEALQAEATDDTLSQDQRRIAEAALNRLWSLVQEG
ncbi:MAG: DNA repair exonuclease [Alphaproteobacteria bacterium]|nr:MAG: DNA repair exonuclease [Alphaproteobacteria bacterium]